MEEKRDSIKLAFEDVGRLADELQLAKELQQSMIPKFPPTLDRFEISANWLPANEMSGDFYDFIQIDSDRWGIVLGDVTGKGMPAAMVMALARSALRMTVKNADSSLAVLRALDQQLLGDMATQRMPVSLVYAVLDVYHQTLTISNAGVPHPLMLSPDGQCTEIEVGGYPLGSTIRGFDYVDEVINLKPNSAIIFYSDGIDEAQNTAGESYGFSQLPIILKDRTDLSAQGLVDLILQDTLNYAGDARQDDMTLVVIKAKEGVSSAEHHAENQPYQLVPESLIPQVQQEQGKIEGERRIVTLMTVDFTHLSTLASETVQRVTDTIARIIFEREGLVNRGHANEISGFFGAPIRHANDAVEALNAATEVRDTLRRLAQEESTELEKAKLALCTGTVVISDISKEGVEFSRLDSIFRTVGTLRENTAQGEIWVDANTYKLTCADFDYLLSPPIEMERSERVLQPYRFIGQRQTDQFAFPDKIAFRQELQLQRLLTYANKLINEGKGRIISIVGEPGVGKHRLMNACKDSLDNQVMWVTSGCVPEKRYSSYTVFIPLLQRVLNIDTSRPAADLSDSLKQELEKLYDSSSIDWLFSVDELRAYLKVLFLPDEPPDDQIAFLSYEQLQRQTFVAIRDILAAAAHRKPIVLVLDDLQWLDDVSKDQIVFLIDDFAEIPLLLLCLSHSQDWWLRDHAMRIAPESYESIVLELMSLAESTALLDSILPGASMSETLKTRILRRTSGNPFHISQLVKLLEADGILVNHNDSWLVLEDVDSIPIPNTLEGVLTARIDRLNINAREVMQYAALLGAIAEPDLLREMANFIPHLDYHLQKLQDLGFIEGISEAEKPRHQRERVLISDIIYAGIPQQERIMHHDWIAQWLETHGSKQYEFLEFHYSRTNNSEKTVEYLIRAGHRARQCFNNTDAVTFYERTDNTIRDANLNIQETLQELYEGLGDVFKSIGRYSDALASYGKLLESYQETTDCFTEADTKHRAAEVYIRQSNWDDALSLLKSAKSLLTSGAIDGHRVESGERWWATDRPTSVSALLGYIDHHIGYVYSQQDNLTEAINVAQNALSVLQETDSPSIWARIHGRIGTYYTQIGDLERAETHLRKGVEYANRIGNEYWLSVFYNDLGVIARALNQFGQAIEYYEKSIRIKRCLKDFDTLSQSYFRLAQTYRETDDLENTLRHLNNALEYSAYSSQAQEETETIHRLIEELQRGS